MRHFFWIAPIVLFAAFVAGISLLPKPKPPKPLMGWAADPVQAVSLPVAGESHIALPAGKVRIEISAQDPVTVVVAGRTRDNVLRVADELEIHEGEVLVLRDGRTQTDQVLAGAAAIITSSSKQADRALSPNRVNVALFDWRCIANCGSSSTR